MARLLVLGSMSFDVNWIGTRSLRKLGGVVTYAGLTARRLGFEVGVVTSVGWDDHHALDRLGRDGVVFHARIGAASTRFVNSFQGNRRVQRLDSVADPIRARDLPEIAGSTVLLGALHPGDIAADVLDRLESFEGPVVADLQGWVRRVEGREVLPGASPELERVLRRASVIKADPDELAVALESLGCDEAALCERFGVEELVITAGRRGGHIRLAGGGIVEYAAAEADPANDTTGAGDVFFAAYLAARSVRGLDAAAAAREAAAVAARQVEGRWLEETLLALETPA